MLIAMMILIVGLLALVSMLDTSLKASMTTSAREGATNLSRQIIEDARTIPYAQIVPTSIEGQLQAMNGLADASSAEGWQIDQRGFVYTVKVEECAINDPKDGTAPTQSSTFCEEQPQSTAGTVNLEPEDLKRITAAVSWTIQKRTRTEKQVSTLTAAGQAIGLIARELELEEPPSHSYNEDPTKPIITNSETSKLTFKVSFPEGATAIDWLVEGAKREETKVSANATSAQFTWTINEPDQHIYVSDGTYQIAAEAVNATGVIGPPISIPVILIRGTPAAPSGVVGGFNTVYDNGVAATVAELQWKANSERDVIGYRVYGPSKELVCPESAETRSTATSCIDFLTSKPSELAFSVVALYLNPAEPTNELKESPATALTVTSSQSVAPNPPTNLVLTKNADGSVTLKWTPPTSGAEVSFYRIYRGSTSYTSRYGETAATEFTDTEASATHEYWVTAVGKNLTESAFLGPVSG